MKKVTIYMFLLLITKATVAQQGFFLNDWQPKTITISGYTDIAKPAASATVTVTINTADTITRVSKYLFGNNSNLWMGQLVTEPNLLTHVANLKPNLIRAPGGSISDVYFWNSLPDQPPTDAPDSLMDAEGKKTKAGFWYGKNTAGWTLALDNYYNMLQQTNNKGIIVVNYGYARYGRSADPVAAAAHLAAEWVRYDNGRTKFWEVGNECNGTWEAGYRIDVTKNKDGQPEIVTGDLYGRHFNVFADSMRAAAQQIGTTIYIGAYILEKAPESWQTATDKSWNQGVINQVKNKADFYIVHSYYTPYNVNSNASVILNSATDNTVAVMNYVTQNIIANGGTAKPLAMTEYNIFSTGSKQQVSHINGMHAAIAVSEMMKNKFGQSTRWDMANGWSNGDDHGMFNNGDEPNGIPKWNPRPDFYHLYFLQKFCGDHLVTSSVTGSADVLSYATVFNSGQAGVTLFNKGTTAQTVKINLQNFNNGNRYYWYSLTGSNDNGEFSQKVIINDVQPTNATGGPLNYASINPHSSLSNDDIKITLPARAAIYMLVERGNITTGMVDIDPASKLIQLINNPSVNGSFSLIVNGFLPADNFDLEIIDVSGKLIRKAKFNTTNRYNSYQPLAAGVYQIVIKTVKGTTVKRLVVK